MGYESTTKGNTVSQLPQHINRPQSPYLGFPRTAVCHTASARMDMAVQLIAISSKQAGST